MSTTTTDSKLNVISYNPAPAQSTPLYRMPLVWVAVLTPAAFVLYLFFLTPSL